MTKPWRVDVLECRGSSYDVGKQMAEGFQDAARSAYGRRRERRPFAFSLRNAQAALQTGAQYLGGTVRPGRRPENPARARGRRILECPLALSAARLLGGDEWRPVRPQLRLRCRPLRPHPGRDPTPRRQRQHRLLRPLHRPPRRNERTRALRRPASGQQRGLATGPRLHPDRPHGARSMRHDARRHRASAPDSPWRRLQLLPDGRRRHGGGRRGSAGGGGGARGRTAGLQQSFPVAGAAGLQPAKSRFLAASAAARGLRPPAAARRPAVQGAQQLPLARVRSSLQFGFRHASYDRLYAGCAADADRRRRRRRSQRHRFRALARGRALGLKH